MVRQMAKRVDDYEDEEPRQQPITSLKILVIGESNVGKSSLMNRFIDDVFDPNVANTIGVDYRNRIITVDGQCVQLGIWDTAGQERFRTLTPTYYRNAQGAIIVYDVTRRQTFERVEQWLQELDAYVNRTDVVKMIVGNKIDLKNREVSREEGQQLARRHSTLFIEASALENANVQVCFEDLVYHILQTPGLWEAREQPGRIQLGEESPSLCSQAWNCISPNCSLL
ncbi:ras-related protein Rab-18-B-like [Neocloeon triangulifer]|uniref:ras-related protein Rab-18-B-like n=1 Tax=Neocloeon triangulifer TaxID=2078957 RepID=UPI00286F2E08|nr:ras-related protein Rab-18-B-like [Neocloeon triangulifer]